MDYSCLTCKHYGLVKDDVAHENIGCQVTQHTHDVIWFDNRSTGRTCEDYESDVD